MNSFVKPDSEPAVGFGPFAFYRQQRLVTRDGQPLALGGRALDVLQVLVEHAGHYVSTQTLIAHVWPDSVVEAINLRVHIAALRRAFGDGRSGARYILNHPRQGYCLAVPLALQERVESPVSPQAERHNLPARLSPVVGRDKVLGRLLAQVPRQTVTTVTGPGGAGKTTVVSRVAELLLEHFEDGAWFVDLAAISDPSQVVAQVAGVLGVEQGLWLAPSNPVGCCWCSMVASTCSRPVGNWSRQWLRRRPGCRCCSAVANHWTCRTKGLSRCRAWPWRRPWNRRTRSRHVRRCSC
ncbi:winged helix-turn-helix domain-containing protein [Pseudomonas sp. NA13]